MIIIYLHVLQWISLVVPKQYVSDIYSLCVSYPDCHLEQLYKSTCDLLVDHVTQLRRVCHVGVSCKWRISYCYRNCHRHMTCYSVMLTAGRTIDKVPSIWISSMGTSDVNCVYIVFIIYSYFNRESHIQQLSVPSTDPCHPTDMELNNGVHFMEIYQVMNYNEVIITHCYAELAVSYEAVEDWDGGSCDRWYHSNCSDRVQKVGKCLLFSITVTLFVTTTNHICHYHWSCLSLLLVMFVNVFVRG